LTERTLTVVSTPTAPEDRESGGSPVPEQTGDDTDIGWGEPVDDDPEDLARLVRERPPHHLG
jgi:hypothetical protein